MSGIAGRVDFGSTVDPAAVARMLDAMVHRGPDGIAQWSDAGAALGHCMLRTTPQSICEKQPLASADGNFVLVLDGRVDNWEELRKALSDAPLPREPSDAALVIQAYARWSDECVQKIEGEFALAIWDRRRQRLFCARDRMGGKPFYYSWKGRAIAFASELQSLLAADDAPPVENAGMLAEFLAGEWIRCDETLWQGVLRLPPAHTMIVDASGPRLGVYWRPRLGHTIHYRKESDYFEHYKELLTDCVRRMSRSHRPLAFEVSGGLDSSSVLCLASGLKQAGRLPAPEIRAYTTTFADYPEADEVRHARAVGEWIGLPIREVPCSPHPPAWYAARARALRDFPGFPNGSMLMGARHAAARDGCRAMLTGESGDFWLWGWRDHYAEDIAGLELRALARWLAAAVRANGLRVTTRELLRFGIFALLPGPIQRAVRTLLRKALPGAAEPYWLATEMRSRLAQRRRAPRVPADAWEIARRQVVPVVDDAFSLQVMERIELDSARAGLEIRHPFNHPNIVEFTLSIPARMKLRGNVQKMIHVEAMRGVLPESVRTRTDKAEFSGVIVRHLAQVREHLSGDLARRRPGWVNAEGIERLFEELGDGVAIAWPMWILWAIYACDLVMPGETTPSVARGASMGYGD